MAGAVVRVVGAGAGAVVRVVGAGGGWGGVGAYSKGCGAFVGWGGGLRDIFYLHCFGHFWPPQAIYVRT